jgi:cell division protein FtsL
MNAINTKNASALRRYFIEYTVIFLSLSVITLFYMYRDLNNKIIDIQNTIIQENTKSNIELKSELQNIKTFSR